MRGFESLRARMQPQALLLLAALREARDRVTHSPNIWGRVFERSPEPFKSKLQVAKRPSGLFCPLWEASLSRAWYAELLFFEAPEYHYLTFQVSLRWANPILAKDPAEATIARVIILDYLRELQSEGQSSAMPLP